jgi:hypothetical protein
MEQLTFPVAVLGQPPKLVREEEDILEFLDQFAGYLQLSTVFTSVRESRLAVHLSDIYKPAKGLVALQLTEFILH